MVIIESLAGKRVRIWYEDDRGQDGRGFARTIVSACWEDADDTVTVSMLLRDPATGGLEHWTVGDIENEDGKSAFDTAMDDEPGALPYR